MKELVALCLLLCACSGSSQSGPCANRQGSFTARFTERQGDCGPITEQVVVFGGAQMQMASMNCTGTQNTTTDNCSITTDLTCFVPATSSNVRLAGTVHWDQAGKTATGTTQMTVMDPGGLVVCTSTYNVRYDPI